MHVKHRLEKLELEIDHFHRQRLVPPLEAALRELTIDELRQLLRELENPTHDCHIVTRALAQRNRTA